MEAIILAGGFGTRLRQVVADVPKPMAPIGKRPFLAILLNSLARKGFDRVILSLGYMAEKISSYFGERFAGMELVYVIEDRPLGTGGGIRLAMEKAEADHVFVFNGDTFLDLEVNQMEASWLERRCPIIVGRRIPDTSRYGRILESEGVITGFSIGMMSGPGIINAGCYLLEQGQLDGFSAGVAFSFEGDFLAKNYMNERFELFITLGRFIDIGIPEDYFRAQMELAEF